MNTHYENIAENFNKMWKFSDDYKIWATKRIGFYLKLNKNDIFVDIGGGTGTFTNMITTQFTPHKVYCVEPEKSMCNIAKNFSNIETICSDAFHFINTLKFKYSKILFKEVIHHIDNRIALWNDIYNTIEENGRILIYTRPQNIEFPLFQKAKDVFYKNQPSYELIVKELKNIGFTVEVSIESFSFKLQKQEWHNMVRSKFMSDLSVFSDKEILKGIEEIENKYNAEFYNIEDKIIFINAYK